MKFQGNIAVNDARTLFVYLVHYLSKNIIGTSVWSFNFWCINLFAQYVVKTEISEPIGLLFKTDEKPPEMLLHKQNSARNIKAEHWGHLFPNVLCLASSERHKVNRGLSMPALLFLCLCSCLMYSFRFLKLLI